MSDARKERKRARRVLWSVRLGTLAIRLLGATWRIRWFDRDEYRARRAAGLPVIWVLWHGQMLPLLYSHRRFDAAVLISEHADGEIIAQVASRFGYQLVRGSTSQGASRALVGLVRRLKEGADIAITPDGPRGPNRSVAPGVLVAAYRSNVPLLPVGVSVDRAWRLKTWDGFVIPKPFARITIRYGPLAAVQATSAREAGEAGPWLHQLMADVEERAASS
jgi:lysophospholipid acyltransferase (LPLAT)-like uncharacterized protein